MDADSKTEEDEPVPLAQIIKQSGLPRSRVLLALGEAGERLRVYPGKGYQGREDRRKKLYPLGYTLALLRESGGRKDTNPEIEADERVPFERVVRELDWSLPTAKRYPKRYLTRLRLRPTRCIHCPPSWRSRRAPVERWIEIDSVRL